MNLLTVQNLACYYGKEAVFKDVSLELNAGDLLCILGPNGSGKSSLLKSLVGEICYTGSIELCGKKIEACTKKERAQNIALMSQLSQTYFDYSVYDTVMMGRYAHERAGFFGASGAKTREVVEDCLKQTGIQDLAQKSMTELSGGQMQRVFLARTLAQDPKIILLDEPTNHLDLKYQVELVNDLKEWAHKKNRAVVGVFHDVNLALNLATKMLILKNGECIWQGSAKSFDVNIFNKAYDMDVRSYMQSCLSRWDGKDGYE